MSTADVPPGPRTRARAPAPVSDHVTDGVAAALLLTSLVLMWDAGSPASSRVDVVLITLFSVASLALPHLARASVFPVGWTVLSTRRARLLANAPYAVMVLVYLVLDATSGVGDDLGVRGIGYAVALGLAGAVLAAQPRRSELGPLDQDRGVGPLWFAVTAVLVGVCGLLLLVGTVLGLVSAVGPLGVATVASSIIFALLQAAQTAVLALPLLALVLRGGAWRPVVLAVGAAVALGLLCSGVATGFGVSTVQVPGVALLLVPAAAAAGTGPAALRAMRAASPSAPAQGWLRVAGSLWLVLVGAAALQVVNDVLQMVIFEELRGAAAVVVVVLLLVTVVVSLVGRARLISEEAAGAPAALLLAGAGVVVGIVVLAVVGATEDIVADGALVTVVLWLPVAVVAVLTVPPSVRSSTFANRPQRSEAATGAPAHDWHVPPTHQGGAPVPQAAPAPADLVPAAPAERTPEPVPVSPEPEPAPVAPEPAPVDVELGRSDDESWSSAEPTVVMADRPAAEAPAPPPAPELARHPFTPAQAADPATDPALLATICAQAPELRPDVAANPSAYPALLEWLAALEDDRVDQALRSRPAR